MILENKIMKVKPTLVALSLMTILITTFASRAFADSETKVFSSSEVKALCENQRQQLMERLLVQMPSSQPITDIVIDLLKSSNIPADSSNVKSVSSTFIDRKYPELLMLKVNTRSTGGNKVREFQTNISLQAHMRASSSCGANWNAIGELQSAKATLTCSLSANYPYSAPAIMMFNLNTESSIPVSQPYSVRELPKDVSVTINLPENTRCHPEVMGNYSRIELSDRGDWSIEGYPYGDE